MTSATVLLAGCRVALAGVPREALGEHRRSRFRGERIVRVGSAWHVGVLLLTDDEALAVGEVLRAADAGRRGYTAESARLRAERRDQARRGGFAEGEVLHLGWTRIDVAAVDVGGASGPLESVGGIPHVRWSAAGELRPLADYLAERVALLPGPTG